MEAGQLERGTTNAANLVGLAVPINNDLRGNLCGNNAKPLHMYEGGSRDGSDSFFIKVLAFPNERFKDEGCFESDS